MKPMSAVRMGGISLIAGALAFMGVFAYLAASFDYPAILDGSAATVLPRLLATGDRGRGAWSLYALLPLIWVPAGVGAMLAYSRQYKGFMRLAQAFSVIAAMSMMLGLMRWPSLHWHLAKAWETATPEQQLVIGALFDGSNTYLGNFIGEFLGELSFSLFFLIASLVMLRSRETPRWIGWLGLLTAVAGLLGMWRNVTGLVQPVAEINNYLLPLWMIVFGVHLLRHRDSAGELARC